MMTNPHDDLHSLASEHNEVVRIERLTHHIQRIREDQHAMRAAIERMSEAVTRLALVEERQAAASTAIERLAQSLEKLDERLRHLEVSEPMQTKAAEWVQSALWAAAAAGSAFFLGRELAQAEYRYIKANGGSRYSTPLWPGIASLHPRWWSRARGSRLDQLLHNCRLMPEYESDC